MPTDLDSWVVGGLWLLACGFCVTFVAVVETKILLVLSAGGLGALLMLGALAMKIAYKE